MDIFLKKNLTVSEKGRMLRCASSHPESTTGQAYRGVRRTF
ncbi:MAG: hypothetical protein ABFD75_10220 [Smithella sp.]